MKYGLISLVGLFFIAVISSNQGQTSGQWSEPQPSVQQKKPGLWQRFKGWREDRSSRRKQNQSSNFTEPSPTPTFENMCDTICKPPKACQLSDKEIAYCNQNCGGQIDLKGCLSDPVWAIVRQKMTGMGRQSFEEGSTLGGREEQLKELERTR